MIRPFVENLGKLPETFFTEGGPKGDSPVSTIPGGEGFFDSWVIPKPTDFLTDGEFDEEKYKHYALIHVWSHHGGGTCKMGPSSDPKAVVDQKGLVYGVQALRICDASIAPTIPGADTQIACYMYGERITEFINNDYDIYSSLLNK